MLAGFLNFVLDCWMMVISTLENTNLGGLSYISVLISIGILSIIVSLILSKKH